LELDVGGQRFNSQDPSYFSLLAMELYVQVFSFLSYKDLRKVAAVSSTWHALTKKVVSHLSRDIVFVCDITSSMRPHIESIKGCIPKFMKILNSKYNTRFGFVGYRDHDPKQVNVGHDKCTVSFDFSQSPDGLINFMNKVAVYGGDDYHEAVLDGLSEALKLTWKSEIRIVILACDAPPHGRQYACTGTDSYPDGCPCGLTEASVLQEYQSKSIKLSMVNLHSRPEMNTMIRIFRGIYPEIVSKETSSTVHLDEVLCTIAEEV